MRGDVRCGRTTGLSFPFPRPTRHGGAARNDGWVGCSPAWLGLLLISGARGVGACRGPGGGVSSCGPPGHVAALLPGLVCSHPVHSLADLWGSQHHQVRRGLRHTTRLVPRIRLVDHLSGCEYALKYRMLVTAVLPCSEFCTLDRLPMITVHMEINM